MKTKTLPLSWTKMCGAGNDFLITDSLRWKEDFSKLRSQVVHLCDRKFGLGADGVCFLTPSKDKILWEFFNSDGSSANMCGNAACCIIEYVYKKNLWNPKTRVVIQIKDKTLQGDLNEKGQARLYTPLPKKIETKQFQVGGESLQAVQVDSGVLHLLVETDQVKEYHRLKNQALALRKQDSKSNVTFYNKESASCITFEKGVEDFTLACGTGALAVAFLLQPEKSKVFYAQMEGGVLQVIFRDQHAELMSPVRWIAEASPLL